VAAAVATQSRQEPRHRLKRMAQAGLRCLQQLVSNLERQRLSGPAGADSAGVTCSIGCW